MTRYATLFDVVIGHDYHTSRDDLVMEAQPPALRAALARRWSVAEVLRIAPDAPTQAALRGLRLLFRATADGFLVAVPTDPAQPGRPLLPPPASMRLCFGLWAADPRLANYTELGASAAATPAFYRFGNDSGNAVAGALHLSRRAPAFDAARAYAAGDSHARASGTTFDLFVARRDTGPSAVPVAADWRRAAPDTWDAAAAYNAGAVVLASNRVFRARVDAPGTDLNDATRWQPLATLANQYAGAPDAVRPVGTRLALPLAALALGRAVVRLAPADGSAVTEQAFAADAGGTLDVVTVDLGQVPPGRVRIDVLDGLTAAPRLGLDAYRLDPGTGQPSFGVIEITAGSGDFAVFNGDGTLRSPRYLLRFLNRATRWRYLFAAPQAPGAGAEVAPEAGDARVLVTPQPRALTRWGTGSRLQADVPATAAALEDILLPVPEVHRVRRDGGAWYSETHVGNSTIGP